MIELPPALRPAIRRAINTHRRLLAAALAAASVACAISVIAPNDPPAAKLIAASRDLPGGVALTDADVVTVAVPLAIAPKGAITVGQSVVGRVLASAIRRGEPLTDVRLVGPALIGAGAQGLVAAPVRIADAEAAGLVRPGDVVDVLAASGDAFARTTTADAQAAADPGQLAPPQATTAHVVAHDVRVVTVPRQSEDSAVGGRSSISTNGALLLVEVTPAVASELAAAAAGETLSVVLRRS